MTLPISAVIFDLNGIFITSVPLSERFHKDFGIPVSAFRQALDYVMGKVRKPQAPDTYSLFRPYLNEWHVNMDRATFYRYWFSAEKMDSQMIAVAMEMKKKGVKLIALSNNFQERIEYYHSMFPFIKDLFDEVRYSCQTGLIKPDVNCWQSILIKYSLEPSTVLYFDDSEKNAAVASSIGIKAFKFEDASKTRNVFELEWGNV